MLTDEGLAAKSSVNTVLRTPLIWPFGPPSPEGEGMNGASDNSNPQVLLGHLGMVYIIYFMITTSGVPVLAASWLARTRLRYSFV